MTTRLKSSMDSDLLWRFQTIPGPDKLKVPEYISPFGLDTLSNSAKEDKQKGNSTGSTGSGAIEGKSSSNGQ